ncbi:MAG: Imm74 family immunity protein [Lysobacter sp.]
MELLEITRGHVLIKDGDRRIVCYGEGLLRKYGALDYVLYRDDVRFWESTGAGARLEADHHAQVLAFVQAEFLARGMMFELE